MIKKLLIALFVSCAPLWADQVAVSQFGLLNNNSPATALDSKQAQDLLNVDVTPGGLSVKKRSGYGLYKALSTGQAMHGGFHAFDSSGNDYQLWGSSTSLYAIVQDATPVQLISSATLNSTWDCTDTQGNSYCVTSSRDLFLRTNGTTKTWFTTPLGTMVESTPDRVIVAGVSGSPNTLFVSQSNTFTNFTVGTAATDPFNEVIASPGSHITHIRWGCAKLLWWKDASFGYFDFDDQFTAQIKTVSDVIGTLDNTSAIDPGGRVWFRGQDGHTWMYDCSSLTKQSVDITPNVQASGRRTANAWTQSSQAEFATGGVTLNGPSVSVSTAILSGSVVPSSFTGLDTDSSTFSQGSFTSAIDTTTDAGAIALNTYVNSPFTSLTGWTTTAGAWSTSGSALVTSSNNSGLKRTSSPNPSGDFVLQFEINGNSACTNLSALNVGVLNASGSGYAIQIGNGGSGAGFPYRFTLNRCSSWIDASGCQVSAQSTAASDQTCDSSWHQVQLTHENLTGGTSFYWDGNFKTVFTSATPTSFTDLKISAVILPASGIRNLYLAARTGNFNSRAIDTGFFSPLYGIFTANGNGVATPTYAVRTSSSSSTAYGADSVITSGSVITNGTNKRYLVYSATMTFPNGSTAATMPNITDVSFIAASTGTYYSAVKNAPNLTAWSTFGTNQTLNDGTLTYFLRSSTNSFTVLSATPTWVAQTIGGLVSASTGTYFQVRDDFAITVATQVPTLNDLTVNWFEGSATDQAYMLYFDNAIWESVAFGAGISVNNYIFKYDLINDGWTLYNFGAGGLLSTAQTLYFGDTAAGNVYNFGTTTGDNGSTIQAYWRSKAFTGPDPFLQTQLTNIDTFAKKNQGSTLTATYTIENSTSTAYSISLSTGNTAFIQSRKLLPSGKLGYTFDMKYGDTSASSAWEILGFRIGFAQQPYRPTN